jgi:predicted transcriptional regulator
VSNAEEIANEFLEVASEQRLSILLNLSKEKMNLSGMARRLDATAAELHRNFGRLQKAGLVIKDPDGNYGLTLYGKTVCAQIPTIEFMSKNKKYFEAHDFSGLATKYIQRIGALAGSDLISGYVKVMEQWENIYKNAEEHIRNILIEIPYNEKLLGTLESKLKQRVKISSIFSDIAVISKERQDLLSKFDFAKYIRGGTLERKMQKGAKIAIVLNEKEAGISFPTSNGEPDMSKMFYGTSESFQEWCLDLFNESWKNSSAFQEAKIAQH